MKASPMKERTGTRDEGMNSDEMSLGTVEDELYFGREEKGVFFLQRT